MYLLADKQAKATISRINDERMHLSVQRNHLVRRIPERRREGKRADLNEVFAGIIKRALIFDRSYESFICRIERGRLP